VFESVCNNKYFASTAMILFMNKIDLFELKIPTTSIRVCFPEYRGSDDVGESSEYIRDKFLEQNHQNKVQTDNTQTTTTTTRDHCCT